MAQRTHSKHSSEPADVIASKADGEANPLIEHDAVLAAIRSRVAGGNRAAASDARHRAWLRQAVKHGK